MKSVTASSLMRFAPFDLDVYSRQLGIVQDEELVRFRHLFPNPFGGLAYARPLNKQSQTVSISSQDHLQTGRLVLILNILFIPVE
jgi:hypothetical protein